VSTRSPIGKAVMALATFSVASGLAVLSTFVASPTPAAFGAIRAQSSAASGPCVAVIVDFRKLGGQVQTGCAQGDPSTGLKALSAAGFSYTPRPRDGLICQINAKPACTDTTTTNYWSYWYRAAGSSHWVYATEGAGSHNPKPGSTEGWVWQDGGKTPPPSTAAKVICPQLASSPAPTPTKTKPASPKPTGPASSTAGTGTSHSTSTKKPASPGSTSTGRGSAGATPSTGSPTRGSNTPTPTSASGAPPTDGSTGAAADPADDGGGGALGGAAGVALGSAVVLGIGAATVVRARRGRSP
jgi:hypothetical protein